VKIAFYIAKYGNWYDTIISFLTKSKYSHCEMVFSDGMCASSSPRDNGVRFKKIDLTNGKWDVFDFKVALPEAAIRRWFINNDGDKYHWLGAVGSFINIDFYSSKKKFCSQACGIVLNRKRNQTPEELFQDLKSNNLI
jgi:hypothetical protein